MSGELGPDAGTLGIESCGCEGEPHTCESDEGRRIAELEADIAKLKKANKVERAAHEMMQERLSRHAYEATAEHTAAIAELRRTAGARPIAMHQGKGGMVDAVAAANSALADESQTGDRVREEQLARAVLAYEVRITQNDAVLYDLMTEIAQLAEEFEFYGLCSHGVSPLATIRQIAIEKLSADGSAYRRDHWARWVAAVESFDSAAAREICRAVPLHGPWICTREVAVSTMGPRWTHFVKQANPQGGCAHGVATMTGWHAKSPEGDFVAAARTLLPAALDALDAARAEGARLADDVARMQAVANLEIFESGAWAPCPGCHQTDEGASRGRWSAQFRCHLGVGCHECGGLGAVWWYPLPSGNDINVDDAAAPATAAPFNRIEARDFHERPMATRSS